MVAQEYAPSRKPRYNARVKFAPTFCWLPRGTPTPAGFMHPYAAIQQAIPRFVREQMAEEDARIARARNAHLIAILTRGSKQWARRSLGLQAGIQKQTEPTYAP